MNIVLVRGVLSRPPEARDLPSGDSLVAYEVTVPAEPAGQTRSKRAESVPVVWFGPPHGAQDFDAGAEVLVSGRVRRRFFRAGGTTQSRTEVVADKVVDAGDRRRSRAMLRSAAVAVTATG